MLPLCLHCANNPDSCDKYFPNGAPFRTSECSSYIRKEKQMVVDKEWINTPNHNGKCLFCGKKMKVLKGSDYIDFKKKAQ